MKIRMLIPLLALFLAMPAQAAPGFYAETTLVNDDTVIVSAGWSPVVRLVYNRALIVTPTTFPGGCSLRLTLEEAELIGDIYELAASLGPGEQLDEIVELTYGGPYGAEVRIIKGAVDLWIGTVVDTGSSPTSACTDVDMTADEAFEVGGWLLEAAAP